MSRASTTGCLAPYLGEHNSEVLSSWLDYSDEQINALKKAGVLVTEPPSQ